MATRTTILALIIGLVAANGLQAAEPTKVDQKWTACGWGGGGFFYSAVFHPTKDGVIYLGGDVNGCYKSEDHGKSWRIINNGIVDYGVFAMAVDPNSPETVYAATHGGMCKSTDGGEHWELLPDTGRKQLRITGEKNRSYRSVAVDPRNGNTIYGASPNGKVYKSTDGGKTWNQSYAKATANEPNCLRAQFGGANGQIFGGMWSGLKAPADAATATGFGFRVKCNGVEPDRAILTVKLDSGEAYVSKNLKDIFGSKEWQDVTLSNTDFKPDPSYLKKHPEKKDTMSPTPDWTKLSRFDLCCVGQIQNKTAMTLFKRFYLMIPQGNATTKQTVLDFTKKKKLQVYGNCKTGGNDKSGTVYAVAVSPHDSNHVAAGTQDEGVVLSTDGGKSWQKMATPTNAVCVTFSGNNANTLYASFLANGIYKSTDLGKTWAKVNPNIAGKVQFRDIVVNPSNDNDVYVIASKGWDGAFYSSHDGGKTWAECTQMTPDPVANPTLPQETAGKVRISNPRNLAINPNNPNELFIASNWRPCVSQDAGKSWQESSKGADISCVTDMRFTPDGKRAYVTVMDEGSLVTADNGKSWKQLWPYRYNEKISGHNWRIAVTPQNGTERLIATSSPWSSKYPNRIIRSEDGGKTYEIVTAGLPNYIPKPNTMWGRSYPRAMAVDPNNPDTIYLGMDGDPEKGKSGGGIFKSTDGGKSWSQLPGQPGSRRMYYGLVVDPTDSNRIFWSAGGKGAGVYRTEDGGNSWKKVFGPGAWLFNLMISPKGTIFSPGNDLYRSTDHGNTWKKISNFGKGPDIVGMTIDPENENRIWISKVSWGGGGADGGIYKTEDGGKTWTDISGDIPYRKPMVLRYNPVTKDLWAGGVGIYRTKQ